jgi:hypothetical protein
VLPAVPWFLAAAACSPPGVLWGPSGRTELRTAAYAIGVRDQQPELTILLSNGVLGCAAPVRGEAGVAEAIEAEATALCREGAQHVVLSVLDPEGEWSGEFSTGASSGAYYGIDEAVLSEVTDLSRTYLAIEDRFLDDLGPGTVSLAPSGASGAPCEEGIGRVRGWFSFPDSDLSGRFVASPCPCTEATTLQLLSRCLPLRCGRVDGIGCQ